MRGHSSGGERLIHIQEAVGSKPSVPTTVNKGFSGNFTPGNPLFMLQLPQCHYPKMQHDYS